MKTVLTIILVMLALVAAVLFFLVGQNKDQAINPVDDISVNTSDLIPPKEIVLPTEVIPVDPTIDCATDFSCFSGHLSSCKKDVKYLQSEKIEYPLNGTKYNFYLEYTINGLNQFDECLVGLTLLEHRISFLEIERQRYLAENYTEAGVLEIEDLLNISSTHLVKKSGVCKLDISSHNLTLSSLQFLDRIMQGYENCSGELFTSTGDPSEAQFFIYIN